MKKENLEIKVPVVALRGMVILPGMITHFDVSRTRSLKAIEHALKQEQKLFIAAQRDPEEEEPDQKKLFSIGTVAEIKQIVKMPHQILRVLVEGLYSAEIQHLEGEEYLEGTVVRTDPEGFAELHESRKEAMCRNLKEIYQAYGSDNNKIGRDILRQVMDSADLERLMVQVMVHTPFSWEQQQKLLEACTANDIQTIPRPLLDRMEVIEVSSYTENEKMHIAKDHLLPKQMKRHGLKKSQLQITEKALGKIIHQYTREAGVRNLERKIASVCRKADREILEEGKNRVRVTEKNLEKYLGKTVYEFQKRNEKDEVGIVRGLAWTSVGGDTLEIEVNLMPGKGNLELTGQMGDVMQESARAGISYIRSISPEYGLEKDYFQEHDIHIHIPEGAVPKDGPSAGITMATAMLSAVLEKPVRADVAMTGEITLRGRVLPIGGLKEKLLAAGSAGMKTVIVPKKNKRDVEELSEEITGGLELVYAEAMDEVIAHAFV